MSNDATTADANLPTLDTMPPPAVVGWYRLYGACVALAMLGIVVFYVWASIRAINDPNQPPGMFYQHLFTMSSVAGVYGGFGLVYAVLPWFVRRHPAWYFVHGGLMLASMLCVCSIPAVAALVFFWVQPEVRLYFRVGG